MNSSYRPTEPPAAPEQPLPDPRDPDAYDPRLVVYDGPPSAPFDDVSVLLCTLVSLAGIAVIAALLAVR